MKRSPVHMRGERSRRVSTSVRFPVDEYLRITRAAQKRKLSVSDYIRAQIPEATVNLRVRRA